MNGTELMATSRAVFLSVGGTILAVGGMILAVSCAGTNSGIGFRNASARSQARR